MSPPEDDPHYVQPVLPDEAEQVFFTTGAILDDLGQHHWGGPKSGIFVDDGVTHADCATRRSPDQRTKRLAQSNALVVVRHDEHGQARQAHPPPPRSGSIDSTVCISSVNDASISLRRSQVGGTSRGTLWVLAMRAKCCRYLSSSVTTSSSSFA